jgi:hypothetical protein
LVQLFRFFIVIIIIIIFPQRLVVAKKQHELMLEFVKVYIEIVRNVKQFKHNFRPNKNLPVHELGHKQKQHICNGVIGKTHEDVEDLKRIIPNHKRQLRRFLGHQNYFVVFEFIIFQKTLY